MSIQVVVDSSVAYKWFYREGETGLDEADELLHDHREGRAVISAPITLPSELCNALRHSLMSPERAMETIELIGDARIHLYHTDTRSLLRATSLAFEHDLTVYDALFLALAEELNCPLVTADRRAFGRIETDVEIRLL